MSAAASAPSSTAKTPSESALKREFETALLKKFVLPEEESTDPNIQELHDSIRHAVNLFSSMWAEREANGQGGRGDTAAIEQLLDMQRRNIGSNVQQALVKLNALPPTVTK